jgi:hypothetical protein
MQIASGPTEQPLYRSVLVEHNHVRILNLIYRNKHLNGSIVLFGALLYHTATRVTVGCVCVYVCVCVCMKNRRVLLCPQN